MKIKFTEAICVRDGRMQNLKYHQARVNATTARFCIGSGIDLSVLMQMIPTCASNGLYKCRVLYGEAIEAVEYTPMLLRQILFLFRRRGSIRRTAVCCPEPNGNFCSRPGFFKRPKYVRKIWADIIPFV